jgi:AraC-like DNA-binding protein
MKGDNQTRIRLDMELLKAKLLGRLPEPGSISTGIEGLRLSRRDQTKRRENCFYRPVIGVVVQGSKRSVIGNEEFRYGEGCYLAVGVDMPGVVHITQASPEKPFLSLSIALNRHIITQLAAELPAASSDSNAAGKAAAIAELTPEMLNAFLRLVELLDTPERIPALAPLVIREIYYYALTGPVGGGLRLFTQDNQIVRAISWLRENYMEPLRVTFLARRVNMAESTFNRHFHRVTGLSPLQFHKRLRLYEAQRLMLTENKSAETASLEVGYGSSTQFNREYKRQFGEPPHRDMERLLDTSGGLQKSMGFA